MNSSICYQLGAHIRFGIFLNHIKTLFGVIALSQCQVFRSSLAVAKILMEMRAGIYFAIARSSASEI